MKTNHFFILKKEKSISYEKPKENPKINSLRSSSLKNKSPKKMVSYPQIKTEKKHQKQLNGFNVKFLKEENIPKNEANFETKIKFNSGRWTKEEHNKFIRGLIEFGNDWKKVQKIIKSRSSSQSRSHAQKFFLKLKNSIKSAKIGNEQNELFEYIFEENKSILDLNDIKLTEEEKKQLLNIIISSINLFDKNKKGNKIVILNSENYNNYSYNNYKDKFITKSNNNSFHSDEDEEDLSQEQIKNNNENNDYKNIKFINNKRKRSNYENNNSENNKSNKDKKIFYIKKCTKYKYSEDFLINKENNNSKLTSNNNGNNKPKNKTITQKFNIYNNTNEVNGVGANNNNNKNINNISNNFSINNNNNNNNINYQMINGNYIINNNIINIMNNYNNNNSSNNIDLSNLNILNNNINTININNINFINNESNKGFQFLENSDLNLVDNNNIYESQKKLSYDYIRFNDQNFNEDNFNFKLEENNDELSIIEQKKINNIFFSSHI